MKIRFCHRVGAAAAAAVLLLSGCGEAESPDPPLAQVDLTNRLVAALQARRIEEALNLADKLLALDPENLALAEMRSRLIGNLYARKCSELLRSHGVDAALNEIRRGRAQYPVHLRLRTIEQQLTDLKKLQSAAQALRNAGDDKTLSAALAAITPLMKSYPGAEQLKLDIAARRKDLLAMREEARRKAGEEARRKAEEEASRQSALQAGDAASTDSAVPAGASVPGSAAPGPDRIVPASGSTVLPNDAPSRPAPGGEVRP